VSYDSINLMIPTYKRSSTKLPLVINSAIDTVSDIKKLKFSFCINEHDIESINFLKESPELKHVDWCMVIENTDQPNLASFWNLLYEKTDFKDESTLVSMVGDDMEFITKDWDLPLLSHADYTDGICVMYCNDDYIAFDKCCVNLFTTRKMIEATEKPFMCELFHADMIDVVWTHLGRLTSSLKYFDYIVIKHNHETKKSQDEWDETMIRLAPVQNLSRTKANELLAFQYAHICAKNVILKGLAKWNKL